MATRFPAQGVRLTRRRFLAVAGVATGVTGASAADVAVAAQTADLATRFEEASRVIRAQTDSGDVAAAVLHVRQADQEMSRAFGAAKADLPFLIASLAKPMTASAVLWLRDRRELALTDAVSTFLPDFRGGERGAVTIHHLLTHTSGLPDMLPENTELRRQHAPLSEFVARTCRTPLLFQPGAKVSYQSMGILLAAAIAEKVSGEPLPVFAKRTLFGPLGMRQTSFGLDGRRDRRDRAVSGAGGRTQRLGLEQPLLAEPRLTVGRRPRDRARSRDVPGGLRIHGRRRAGDGHGARDARDPDRHAAAQFWSGLAARAGRLRPDLLCGDVRPFRFHRHRVLARSGHGHDLRHPHDQAGRELQGQPAAPRVGDHRTHERLMRREGRLEAYSPWPITYSSWIAHGRSPACTGCSRRTLESAIGAQPIRTPGSAGSRTAVMAAS